MCCPCKKSIQSQLKSLTYILCIFNVATPFGMVLKFIIRIVYCSSRSRIAGAGAKLQILLYSIATDSHTSEPIGSDSGSATQHAC